MIRSSPLALVRGNPTTLWLGVVAILAGVALHLPMFVASGAMNYCMAGMQIDADMILGMAAIVLGTVVAGFGLLPRRSSPETGAPPRFSPLAIRAIDDAPLTRRHWLMLVVLSIALIIDTMKPATLAFVLPGVAAEYGLPRNVVALLAFSGLTGTMIGSFAWGFIADAFGRRAAILLAALMFISTSICGTMPSFGWNLVMCFLMGLSAGGLLPIAFTLLSEIVPSAHRGFFLVILGGLATLGGYLAASESARLLEPYFGWRILWLIGFPTGLLLILLNRFIPESPKFLLLQGRAADAEAIMARYDLRLLGEAQGAASDQAADSQPMAKGRQLWSAFALNVCALVWGLVNFGVLLWLPSELRARGFGIANSDALIAESSLLAFPTAAIVAWLYARWSSKLMLAGLFMLTAGGLVGLGALGAGGIGQTDLIVRWLITMLMIGNGGVIAVLLPYAAESQPLKIRGRATGLVAASSKLGGVAAQGVGMISLLPGLQVASIFLACAMAVSAALVVRYVPESPGRRRESFELAP